MIQVPGTRPICEANASDGLTRSDCSAIVILDALLDTENHRDDEVGSPTEASMTQPQNPSSPPTPTPQQLNKITTQLRDLNKAYKAAVAASDKSQSDKTSYPTPR
jgi:hypothetical protein